MIWYTGSVVEAVAEAKKNNKILLVYIEGVDDDMSKQMTDTYNDNSVAEKLQAENIVALKISSGSVHYQQFCAVYPVIVIPSSFFIRGNGEPIEIVTGGLPPTEFAAKIDKVFELHEKSTVLKEPPSNSTTATQVSDASKPSTSASHVESSDIPSTSQTATAAESSSPLHERVERAKTLIEAQRHQKDVEEKEKEKNEEIDRRNMGKAMQKAQQTKKDNELKEWANNRAKEKEEERLAREKVKAMIAQDRAERAARYQMTKEAEQAEKENLARKRLAADEAAKKAALNSNDARIQFRLPDGQYSTHSFSADATLGEARRYVIEHVRPPFSNFSLCTTFPRRHFNESNYSESLRDLALAPSAVLLILPSQTVTTTGPSDGLFPSLFWIILSPFTTILSWIRSFWPQRRQGNDPPPRPETAEPTPSTSTSQPDIRQRQPNQEKKEPAFYKREGNVFRINNQSDDDENNTWNGNSTQQM